MARPPRLEFPGALYHVTVRGNEKRAVFRDDVDRRQYLDRLAHYRERFRFQLLAYCLMTNHVHLAIRAGVVPLSRVMAGIQSSYAQWFNRRHERVGHLFQGRYKAFLVQEDRYLLALIRYVHLNPVSGGIVTHPSHYRWSSDRSFRTGISPDWLDLDAGLLHLGATRRVAVRRYIDLVEGPEIQPSYEALRAIDHTVKGEEVFALERFDAADQLEPLLRGVSEERLIEVVAQSTGLAKEDLAGPQKGGAIAFARCVAAYLGRRFARISTRRLARRLHRDDSSFARPIARLEKRLETDLPLREQIGRMVAELQSGSEALSRRG
jgi:REP element-mobilizing transposase RayT